MAAPLKLTPELLRRIVREERARVMAEAKKKGKKPMRETDEISSKATETEADEMADTVAHKENHYKHVKEGVEALQRLTMTEARLLRQLRSIRETKTRIRNGIKRSV